MKILSAHIDIQLVTFFLNGEEYGVDVMRVREIISMTDITRTANSPHFVKGIIDLRGSMEVMLQGKDSQKLTCDEAHRVSLPLVNGFHPDAAYYRELLKNYGGRRNMVKFFSLMADKSSFPVLYHCAFGKDRTGVMTALLLMALGTPRQSITADYLMSPGVREEWLKAVYQDVDAAGGIEPFLRQVGVTSEVLASVRANLVVPGPAR